MSFGYAKTSDFMFSTATLCIAPLVIGKGINPVDHGIGLVKMCSVTSEPTSAKLTQGVTNQVVDTQTIGTVVKFTAEVYEYTTRNIMASLGQDISTISADATALFPLAATVSGSASTPAVLTVTGDVTTGPNAMQAGSWVFLQDAKGSDKVFVSRLASAPTVATSISTLTCIDPIPASMSFPAGSRVGVSPKIDANPDNMDTAYAVRLIGQMKNSKTPLIIHLPKCKIMKGFNIVFSDKDFVNMPFEFDPLYPIPTDAGYSADFANQFSIFPGMPALPAN